MGNSTLVEDPINPPWFTDLLQLPIIIGFVLAFSCISVGGAWCYWQRRRRLAKLAVVEGHLDGSGLMLGHSPTFVNEYWQHVGGVPPLGGIVLEDYWQHVNGVPPLGGRVLEELGRGNASEPGDLSGSGPCSPTEGQREPLARSVALPILRPTVLGAQC